MGTIHRQLRVSRISRTFRLGGAITAAIFGLVLTGCSRDVASSSNVQASTNATDAVVMGKMSLSLLDSSGTVLYSDSVANSALRLKAGQSYSVKLDVTNMPSGTTYSLVSTRTDIVGGSSTTIPLQPGLNEYSVPAQGDYTWKVIAAPAGTGQTSTKYYQALVSCANPTFTASSLDASKITVTAGGGPNLYTYSAAGIAAGANGMGPYTCAFDPTGVGIVDTGFKDCGQSFSNFYSNYVGARKVGVLVKDACNVTVSVSNEVNLNYTVPGMPGNVFISGMFSNPTGVAANDARVANLEYLATNSGGHNIVNPDYSKGSFTIKAYMNYGMPSSVDFGMEIHIGGIQDTLDISKLTGTVNAANAVIKSVSFKTDQSGDRAAQLSFSSTQCTLSNQGAQVVMTQGTPCSSGTTGDNNQAVVEVWGHYSCTSLTTAGGATSVAGDFDGFVTLADSCVGGGGGGGGGIVPIQL